MKVSNTKRLRGSQSQETKGQKISGKVASFERLASAKPAIAQAPSWTSFDVFKLCIQRAKNLLKIHEAALGKRKARPERYFADAHRAAIVLAVSALDAYTRTFVIDRIRTLLIDRAAVLPEALSGQIKKYLREDGLLEAARKDDLLDRVERAFRDDFERKSFQGTWNITENMKLVGYDDIFHDVAVAARMNEDRLREDLDKFTSRRHVIAHKGDYDLTQKPPKENVVTKKNVEGCIKLVTTIAQHIEGLGKKR